MDEYHKIFPDKFTEIKAQHYKDLKTLFSTYGVSFRVITIEVKEKLLKKIYWNDYDPLWGRKMQENKDEEYRKNMVYISKCFFEISKDTSL